MDRTNRTISASFHGTKASIANKSSIASSNKPSKRQAIQDDSEEEQDDEDDDSFGEEDRRRPKQAEKQRQVSSTHQLPPPKTKGLSASVGPTKIAALARSHATASMGDGSVMIAQRKPITPDAAPPAISVDTTSFEEWMKMATDNKINSTNTWSFALIDYFHDMSLLRNESGDGSINFQKASCTLDGCVKVWTSRVDSVVVETGKLLSGLQDEINADKAKEKRHDGDGEEDLDDDNDDDEEGTGQKSKKRSKNKEATLAKNFSQIQAKKFDLEFTVDPLFKKTSADFDEGGAGGLLMNHLGVDSSVRVVFDASDVAGVGEDGDDMEEEEAAPAVEPDMIDLTKLHAKLFADLEGEDNLSALLSGRVICPTLCNFSFSENDNTPFGVGLDEMDDQNYAGLDQEQARGYEYGEHDNMMMQDDAEGGDFFSGAQGSRAGLAFDGDEDGIVGDDDDGADFFDAPEPAGLAAGHGAGLIAEGEEGYAQTAPDQREIVMAMAFNNGGEAGDDDPENNEAGLFDYFDRKLMKNWAGPEHWKMARVGGASIGLGSASTGKAEEVRTTSRTRKSKEPFVIDFCSEEGAVDVEEIFEKSTASISLPGPSSSRPKPKDKHLLPEDRGFNSKQLLKLFLKPRAAINMRRRRNAGPQSEGEVDEHFWAQAAAAHGSDLIDDDDNGAGMPFDTQFFHDADDGFDPDVDPDDESPTERQAEELEDEEMMQTMAKLNRVKPEHINFAKKATSVDIKKLKDNIWKELDILAAVQGRPEEDEEQEQDGAATPKGRPEGVTKTFDKVLSGLKKFYPQDKMEEISTSYCFICLLHLANEEGLQISTGEAPPAKRRRSEGRKSDTPTPGDESALGAMLGKGARIVTCDDDDAGGEEEEDYEDGLKVGKLKTLRIVKDPKAGRSA